MPLIKTFLFFVIYIREKNVKDECCNRLEKRRGEGNLDG